MEKVTAKEVARKAGVSVGTVSRIINNLGVHSPETVARVRAAMHELAFIPRRPRSRKGQDRVNQVGLVFPDPERTPAGMVTPLGIGIARGADEIFASIGDQLIVSQMRTSESLPLCITEGQVVGVLIRCGEVPDALLQHLRAIPCVWVYGVQPPMPGMDLVAVNSFQLGTMAADIVIRIGRRTVLQVIHDHKFHDEFHMRSLGCRVRLEEAKYRVETVNIDDVVARVKSLGTEPITLFIPGHDLDILSVHEALAAAGISSPERVAIVCGATDYERIRAVNPTIHCISINPYLVGRAAAQQLMWRMKHREEPSRTVMVSPRVIESAKYR